MSDRLQVRIFWLLVIVALVCGAVILLRPAPPRPNPCAGIEMPPGDQEARGAYIDCMETHGYSDEGGEYDPPGNWGAGP